MKIKSVEETRTKAEKALEVRQERHYPPLDQETRSAIPTDAAAFYCSRTPQTLRSWACLDNGPIRPFRVNGRLAWPVAEIKRLLDGGVGHA